MQTVTESKLAAQGHDWSLRRDIKGFGRVCLTQEMANVTIVRSSWLGDRGLSSQIEESPHSTEHGAG